MWHRANKSPCLQEKQQVYVTAGIEEPTDLTGQMTAAVVAATMALEHYGWITKGEILDNFQVARRLYNVTYETQGGVLKHYRSLWTSDSYWDDRLWAVRIHDCTKLAHG
jgi:hypothetical protein